MPISIPPDLSKSMPDGPTWQEVSDGYRAQTDQLRGQARLIYGAMVEHVEEEAKRTGARLRIMDPGTVLSKVAAAAPLAIRMDVTAATALYARQSHVDEVPGEKHRSWSIELDEAPEMPMVVRRGLTRMVEQVARLQGAEPDRPQQSLDLA